MTSDTHQASSDESAGRRDFLVLLAGSLAAIGTASALWPFLDSLNPSADVLAAGAPVDVDISHVQPGQQITVVWRGRPMFIVNRTPQELATLKEPQVTAELRDPNSEALQQPPYATNWHRSIKPEFLVLVGICTHLGCIPRFTPEAGGSLGPNWRGGYFCPCHGSRYDLAGRVFSGVPAPYNLPVPPHNYTSNAVIRIGENPPGSTFDLSSVEQI